MPKLKRLAYTCFLLIAKYLQYLNSHDEMKKPFPIFSLYFLGCYHIMTEWKNGTSVLPYLSRLPHCAMAFVAKKDTKCYCNYYHCDLHDSMLFCVSRERLLLSMRWFLLLSCQCCQLTVKSLIVAALKQQPPLNSSRTSLRNLNSSRPQIVAAFLPKTH